MKRLSLLVLALTVVTARPIAQTQSVPPDQPVQKNVATLAPVRTMNTLIRAALAKEADVAPLVR